MARINDNTVIELSMLLRDIPHDFTVSRYSGLEGGYHVVLHHMFDALCSEPAEGDGKTFAIAYTRAEQKMTRMLQNARVAEHEDHASAIAACVQGTRL